MKFVQEPQPWESFFWRRKQVVLQLVVQSEVVHGCAKSGLESILKLNRSQAEASLV